MSLIYWVKNIKTDAELVLPKRDILSLEKEAHMAANQLDKGG